MVPFWTREGMHTKKEAGRQKTWRGAAERKQAPGGAVGIGKEVPSSRKRKRQQT